jgi:hypothetical protein
MASEWNDWLERPARIETGDSRQNHLLGEEEAEIEWSRKEKPIDTFLHTKSYDQFKDNGYTCLFGRRGTGKSSILHMLRYEVRRNISTQFNFCWMMADAESYKAITSLCRSIDATCAVPEDELRDHFKQFWDWIIKICAMQGYLQRPNEKKSECLITTYLTSLGLVQRSGKPRKLSAARCAANVLRRKLEMRTDTLALHGALEELRSFEFEEAWDELTGKLGTAGKCLVLIDSIDEYNIKDRISRSYISGLLKAVHQTTTEDNYVYAKVAIPSELYPHVTDWHSGKSAARHLFVMWTFKDLVCFLAKRLLKLLQTKGDLFKEQTASFHISFEDLEHFRNARAFLEEVIPPRIISRSGRDIDTLQYITKHTQKRPRQLLIIFNELLARAAISAPRTLDSLEIIECVHKVSGALTSDALENYQMIYENANRLATQMFLRHRNIFPFSQFAETIKEIRNLRGETKISVAECERLFLEAGILGRVVRVHETDELRFVIAEFEYQVKSTIGLTRHDTAVIHPMFYDAFGCQTETRTIIFPTPTDEEENTLLQQFVEHQ